MHGKLIYNKIVTIMTKRNNLNLKWLNRNLHQMLIEIKHLKAVLLVVYHWTFHGNGL